MDSNPLCFISSPQRTIIERLARLTQVEEKRLFMFVLISPYQSRSTKKAPQAQAQEHHTKIKTDERRLDQDPDPAGSIKDTAEQVHHGNITTAGQRPAAPPLSLPIRSIMITALVVAALAPLSRGQSTASLMASEQTTLAPLEQGPVFFVHVFKMAMSLSSISDNNPIIVVEAF